MKQTEKFSIFHNEFVFSLLHFSPANNFCFSSKFFKGQKPVGIKNSMKSQKVCDSKLPSWQVPEIEKDVRRRQNESPKPVKAQKKTNTEPRKTEE